MKGIRDEPSCAAVATTPIWNGLKRRSGAARRVSEPQQCRRRAAESGRLNRLKFECLRDPLGVVKPRASNAYAPAVKKNGFYCHLGAAGFQFYDAARFDLGRHAFLPTLPFGMLVTLAVAMPDIHITLMLGPVEKLKERKERKAQQAQEGREAWTEYQAQADADRAKTARLRAARLARPADVAEKEKLPSKKKR